MSDPIFSLTRGSKGITEGMHLVLRFTGSQESSEGN